MSSFGDLNRVNTNIQSLDSQLSLNRVNKNLAENQLRLSTGLRINRAEDDAAGFSIATKLNSRVAGLNQALQNVGDAKSVLDIAESSFDTIMDNLIEMKALSTQAANDTLGDTERGYISAQIEELGGDINEISKQTVFQDLDLLNGEDGSHEGTLSLTFQTGERAEDTISADIEAVNVNQLFAGSSSIGTVDETTDTATGTALGVGELTAGTTTSATVYAGIDEILIEDSDGGSYGVTGLGISTGEATNLDEVIAEITDLIDANDIEGLSVEEDTNGHLAITSTNTDVTYDVTFTGDLNADGTDTDEVDLQVTEADFTLGEAGQGGMNLTGWDAGQFRNFMAEVDSAIEGMSKRVNSVGIAQSSLSMREVTLSQSISANQSASSRIMDADFAKEQSESIRLQILQQTSTSALSQANIGPQSVLGFLGG